MDHQETKNELKASRPGKSNAESQKVLENTVETIQVVTTTTECGNTSKILESTFERVENAEDYNMTLLRLQD
jgi:hypothetical protein